MQELLVVALRNDIVTTASGGESGYKVLDCSRIRCTSARRAASSEHMLTLLRWFMFTRAFPSLVSSRSPRRCALHPSSLHTEHCARSHNCRVLAEIWFDVIHTVLPHTVHGRTRIMAFSCLVTAVSGSFAVAGLASSSESTIRFSMSAGSIHAPLLYQSGGGDERPSQKCLSCKEG